MSLFLSPKLTFGKIRKLIIFEVDLGSDGHNLFDPISYQI